jgi:hypothetical protein
MATRAEVYNAIDSERDYQEMRRTRDGGQPAHTPTEFLVYMQSYLNEALEKASRVWGADADPTILDITRKVAGLAVASMEENGAIPRKAA